MHGVDVMFRSPISSKCMCTHDQISLILVKEAVCQKEERSKRKSILLVAVNLSVNWCDICVDEPKTMLMRIFSVSMLVFG